MRLTAGKRSSWRVLPVVVAAVVAIAGCGSSNQQPGPSTTSSTHRPSAVRPSAPSTALGHPAAEIQPAAAVIAAGPLVRGFSGMRNQGIGSLSEKTSLVVAWKVTKPPIQIFTSHGSLLLSSDRRSGRIRLARGDYPGLHIATKGHWTVQLRAAA
jgi:hypothetical protein